MKKPKRCTPEISTLHDITDKHQKTTENDDIKNVSVEEEYFILGTVIIEL